MSLTEIDRDHHEGSWPASRETIVVRVGGDLANRVRRRFGGDREVRIYHYGKEDLGADDYTKTQWIWDAVLFIGDVPVRTEMHEGALSGSAKMDRFLAELEQVRE